MIWVVPLESNPEVMTNFLLKLGVLPNVQVVDVLSLEPDMLGFVPQPVGALLLLYPYNEDENRAHRLRQEEEIKASGQFVTDELFFAKQLVRNACGTIALIHGIANMDNSILEGGPLKKYLDAARPLDAEARGQLLENCEDIISAHKEVALEGQTAPPDDLHQPVPFHFVAFVEKKGHLYELDGTRSCPVNHGPSSAASFLQDAARICREYMQRNPDNVNFNVCAITT